MLDYRRNHVPGGTFFFTVNLADRHSHLLVVHIDNLRHAIRQTLRARPFKIDAWVVLPDHMHCIWTLPADDSDYSGRWRMIKKSFTKSLTSAATPKIWQNRFWEHTIRDERDYRAHMDYTHFNPVKHGLATHPADWPYSTFKRCAAQGLYDISWTLNPNTAPTLTTGEPP